MIAKLASTADLKAGLKYFSSIAKGTTHESSPDIFEMLSYLRTEMLTRNLKKPKFTIGEAGNPVKAALVMTEADLTEEQKEIVQQYKDGKFATKVLYIRALAEHKLTKNQITKLTGFYYSQVHGALK